MNIRITLLVFCMTLSGGLCYCHGVQRPYRMDGFALTQQGDTIRNATIMVSFPDRTDTIKIDSNGHYQYIVHANFVYTEARGLKRRRDMRKANPRYLVFTCNGMTARERNFCRKFSFDDTQERTIIYPCDLIFH